VARRDAVYLEAMKGALESSLAAEGLPVASVASLADARFGFDEHMVMIYVFLVVMSAIVGAVGTLGLATSVSLDAFERRREMGVLRAIGATRGTVAMMLTAQGVLVGLLAWLLASALAGPVGGVIADHLLLAMFKTHVAPGFDARGPLVWLAVSVLASAAASVLPAWRASRRSVREALAYE
jgi:putative ABC transport system permease protein